MKLANKAKPDIGIVNPPSGFAFNTLCKARLYEDLKRFLQILAASSTEIAVKEAETGASL